MALASAAVCARVLLEEKGPAALGFYTTGQLFLEEYYTLAVARRDWNEPPRREHAPLHRHGRRVAQGDLRLRRPARHLHGHRPRRHDRALGPQHGRDATRAVDASARPPRRPQAAAPRRDRPTPDAERRSLG